MDFEIARSKKKRKRNKTKKKGEKKKNDTYLYIQIFVIYVYPVVIRTVYDALSATAFNDKKSRQTRAQYIFSLRCQRGEKGATASEKKSFLSRRAIYSFGALRQKCYAISHKKRKH